MKYPMSQIQQNIANENFILLSRAEMQVKIVISTSVIQ